MRGWILVFAVLLAGCADDGGSGVGLASSSSAAPPPIDPSSELGRIEGVVTDDEMMPLAGATVALVARGVETTTGEDGAFVFDGLEPGDHHVMAARIGYESMGRRVSVVSGETTRVEIVLGPIAIIEPYLEVHPHNLLHHVGATLWLDWVANVTGQGALTCSGCTWWVQSHDGTDALFFEVYGRHTVSNPAQRDESYVRIFRFPPSGGSNNIFECPQASGPLNCPLPLKHATNNTADSKKFSFEVYCDNYWVCVEEKREAWVTLFFNQESVPADYSARPPT